MVTYLVKTIPFLPTPLMMIETTPRQIICIYGNDHSLIYFFLNIQPSYSDIEREAQPQILTLRCHHIPTSIPTIFTTTN